MGIASKAYLIAYNLGCCAGWAFSLLKTIAVLLQGGTAGDAYNEMGLVLIITQTAMLLEIIHSVLGLVPSPVATVAIQVASRIFIVWGHLMWVSSCQQHWSLFLMVISWGVTEVVRYLFYVLALQGSVPYLLFWLRYSTFIVLYPTGITGELLQAVVGMAAHWQLANPLWFRLSMITLILYVPGSPGMIVNMWANRKKALKKRNAVKEEAPANGVVWPQIKPGDRSSTATNRGILAAAAGAGPRGATAEKAVLSEKNWRFQYNKHMLQHVRDCLHSTETCLNMAKAGLAKAHEDFKFIRDGHEEMPMHIAMEKFSDSFETAELHGEQAMPAKRELSITYGGPALGKPYYEFKGQRNTKLNGMALRKQLDQWVEYGTMEADVADALKNLQGNQEKWLDLSDKYFVLLGAASAMGPLNLLLSLGANVVCVARPNALKGIFERAKNSPGKIFFPVKKGVDWKGMLEKGDMAGLSKVSGCDLLTETPEIANWITSVAAGKPLTIGNYTYLDGALHVQIAVACDCIISKLCKVRPDTSIAFLGTPTDAHVVTSDAAAVAESNYRKAPLWMKLWEAAGVLKQNKPVQVGDLYYTDAITPDQGPNYILAKRLQHWRAMVAREAGHTVSSNVSPSTATKSVTSNASFAAAFGGMHIFKPMEVVYEELSLSVMGALLLHDLFNPASAAHASTKLQHPLCLFQATGFHGGIWRCPYTISTIGIPSAIQYYFKMFWMYILAGVLVSLSILQYGLIGKLPPLVVNLLDMLPLEVYLQLSKPLITLARALAVPV